MSTMTIEQAQQAMTTETTPLSSLNINPLADQNGDTSKVSAALDFVSWALMNGTSDGDGSIALSAGQAFGLAVLIDTCSSTLKEMA